MSEVVDSPRLETVASVAEKRTVKEASAKLAEMPPHFYQAIGAAKAVKPPRRYVAAFEALDVASEGAPDAGALRQSIAREIVELVNIIKPTAPQVQATVNLLLAAVGTMLEAFAADPLMRAIRLLLHRPA